MPTQILIVEDESAIADNLIYALKTEGFSVTWKTLGTAALDLIKDAHVDLVILDVGLPDMSGFEVCKRVRQFSDVPVLFLTARAEEIDRVVGFELGADDYVTKPFSMRELLLRVAALLRRAGGPAEEPAAVTRFGRLRIDRAAHRVWVDDDEVELTALELRLLLMLHDRKNRVQSRETLLEEVWGLSSDITTRTVDTHVKRLREKLGPAAAYIETVRGAGYRFAEEPG